MFIYIPSCRKDVLTGTTYQAEGFTLEQASILYNMGALHSQLAARESRGSEQEMKEACTHFQCSAGAFAYLLVSIIMLYIYCMYIRMYVHAGMLRRP